MHNEYAKAPPCLIISNVAILLIPNPARNDITYLTNPHNSENPFKKQTVAMVSIGTKK